MMWGDCWINMPCSTSSELSADQNYIMSYYKYSAVALLRFSFKSFTSTQCNVIHVQFEKKNGQHWSGSFMFYNKYSCHNQVCIIQNVQFPCVPSVAYNSIRTFRKAVDRLRDTVTSLRAGQAARCPPAVQGTRNSFKDAADTHCLTTSLYEVSDVFISTAAFTNSNDDDKKKAE
jgi:hypothetical protein